MTLLSHFEVRVACMRSNVWVARQTSMVVSPIPHGSRHYIPVKVEQLYCFFRVYQCINFFVLKKSLFSLKPYLFGKDILFELNKCYFTQINLLFNQKKPLKQIIFIHSIKSFVSVHRPTGSHNVGPKIL